ncbi:helix-turn-helix transcriptional regulator [Arthrobacter sp. Soc17.1.1.1]|uniref:helix-turn-helix domain-containing protein n=1 Tax=Arthrobacter sp. Soc17.1.1.1 TaxID=3121277 RepID=UPI002FE47E9A
MERTALADFLRSRREKLQPEDVGLARGERRRTPGLRREELAALTGMSADYYSRMERGHSPRPSEQMLAALARGLRLSLEDRDYLFRLVGYDTQRRVRRTDHVDVGLMRVVDRLTDTPAAVLNSLGETLFQTQPGLALLGDHRAHHGLARSVVYRWFTDTGERNLYPPEDHPKHSRVLASQLRQVLTREGPRSRAADIADALRDSSTEFAEVWAEHPVGWRYSEHKRLLHPDLGELTVHCQSLLDPEQTQTLLVFTATPGTESHNKLQLLSVIGTQDLSPSDGDSV